MTGKSAGMRDHCRDTSKLRVVVGEKQTLPFMASKLNARLYGRQSYYTRAGDKEVDRLLKTGGKGRGGNSFVCQTQGGRGPTLYGQSTERVDTI